MVMSITKTPNDHSYYYLQRAKRLFVEDKWKTNATNMTWDKLSKVDRDRYEELARKES